MALSYLYHTFPSFFLNLLQPLFCQPCTPILFYNAPLPPPLVAGCLFSKALMYCMHCVASLKVQLLEVFEPDTGGLPISDQSWGVGGWVGGQYNLPPCLTIYQKVADSLRHWVERWHSFLDWQKNCSLNAQCDRFEYLWKLDQVSAGFIALGLPIQKVCCLNTVVCSHTECLDTGNCLTGCSVCFEPYNLGCTCLINKYYLIVYQIIIKPIHFSIHIGARG